MEYEKIYESFVSRVPNGGKILHFKDEDNNSIFISLKTSNNVVLSDKLKLIDVKEKSDGGSSLKSTNNEKAFCLSDEDISFINSSYRMASSNKDFCENYDESKGALVLNEENSKKFLETIESKK